MGMFEGKKVRRLIGVRGLINSINIKARVAPAEIQKRIEQAFRGAAQSEQSRIAAFYGRKT
jgi:hypothetical protein